MYYGYKKRTGRKGDYKYWYEDKNSGKIYEGMRPSDHTIKIHQREIEHPPSKKIMPCPWQNLDSKDFERIETNEGVLFNKGGIIDKKEIDFFENVHYVSLINELIEEVTPNTKLTNKLIKQWHQRFLGQIYPWAGRYRTVGLSKPNFRWPPANRVKNLMDEFEINLLSKTPIKSDDEEIILYLISMIMGEFLIIHPFREGNGRIAKLIAAVLLLQKGYRIPDFSKTNSDDLIDAALDAYSEKYDKMVRILRKVLK